MEVHGVKTENETQNHQSKKLIIKKLKEGKIDTSGPIVKYSETVVHYPPNLTLTAIPQITAEVSNIADMTES